MHFLVIKKLVFTRIIFKNLIFRYLGYTNEEMTKPWVLVNCSYMSLGLTTSFISNKP